MPRPWRQRVVVFFAVAVLAAVATKVAIELADHPAKLGRLFRWQSVLMVIGWATVLNWLFAGIERLWRTVRDRRRPRSTHRKA